MIRLRLLKVIILCLIVLTACRREEPTRQTRRPSLRPLRLHPRQRPSPKPKNSLYWLLNPSKGLSPD
jgi:hypothetical protein